MDLIKFRIATIVLMTITAIITSKDDNLPITFGNIFVILLVSRIFKVQYLSFLCVYSFICMILSVDYIKEKKLFLLYIFIAVAHILQLVSVLNIFFSTI